MSAARMAASGAPPMRGAASGVRSCGLLSVQPIWSLVRKMVESRLATPRPDHALVEPSRRPATSGRSALSPRKASAPPLQQVSDSRDLRPHGYAPAGKWRARRSPALRSLGYSGGTVPASHRLPSRPRGHPGPDCGGTMLAGQTLPSPCPALQRSDRLSPRLPDEVPFWYAEVREKLRQHSPLLSLERLLSEHAARGGGTQPQVVRDCRRLLGGHGLLDRIPDPGPAAALLAIVPGRGVNRR